LIHTKTLIGLCTITMWVSKPFDHLSSKTVLELNAFFEQYLELLVPCVFGNGIQS